LAHRHGIPFYVAIPLSTIDWNLNSGFDIPIEERDQREVLGAWGVVRPIASRLQSREPRGKRSPVNVRNRRSAPPVYVQMANPTSHGLNPGFDVTPSELITGIITPVGIFKPRELWTRRSRLGYQTR
jgi:methylthioribose-1-phosphate isomerase